MGTLASRYSDYDGYWFFGFVVASLTTRTIDLLAVDAREPSTYDDLLVVLARDRFRDQLAKGGLEPTVIAAATLDVTKGEARSERVGDVI
ncbi:MAG TPA: hypothetical protein VF407_04040, partial [Polyangiaceae bacterium]